MWFRWKPRAKHAGFLGHRRVLWPYYSGEPSAFHPGNFRVRVRVLYLTFTTFVVHLYSTTFHYGQTNSFTSAQAGWTLDAPRLHDRTCLVSSRPSTPTSSPPASQTTTENSFRYQTTASGFDARLRVKNAASRFSSVAYTIYRGRRPSAVLP